jgi:hypothetical protein
VDKCTLTFIFQVSKHLVDLFTNSRYRCISTTSRVETLDTTANAYGQVARSPSSRTQPSCEEADGMYDQPWRITVGGKMPARRMPSLPERLAAKSDESSAFFLVEIQSPIIIFDSEICDFENKIKKLCQLLRENYILLRDNRCERRQGNEGRIPRFCVHVGRKHSRVIHDANHDAHHFVRLMAILWVFEGQLNKLHLDYTQWNTMAQQLTPNCSLKHAATPNEALFIILECKKIDQVLELTQHIEKWVTAKSVSDTYPTKTKHACKWRHICSQ